MIELKELSRSYGDTVALKPLSRKLPNRQIYGIAGAAGAGKSTLCALLAGAVAPTEGLVRMGGFDLQLQPEKARKQLGYLPQEAPSYDELTPRELLGLLAEAHGIHVERALKKTHTVLDELLPPETHDRLISALTLFECRLLGLAQAMMTEGDVLILDAPLQGLAAEERKAFCELLQELSEAYTLFVSDRHAEHLLPLCDRILFLSAGEVIADHSAEELADQALLAPLCARLASENKAAEQEWRPAKRRTPRLEDGYEVLDDEDDEAAGREEGDA